MNVLLRQCVNKSLNGYHSQTGCGSKTPETQVWAYRIWLVSNSNKESGLKTICCHLETGTGNLIASSIRSSCSYRGVREPPQFIGTYMNTHISTANFIAVTAVDCSGCQPELQGMLRKILEAGITPGDLKIIFYHILDEIFFSALKQPKEILLFLSFTSNFKSCRSLNKAYFPVRHRERWEEYSPDLNWCYRYKTITNPQTSSIIWE